MVSGHYTKQHSTLLSFLNYLCGSLVVYAERVNREDLTIPLCLAGETGLKILLCRFQICFCGAELSDEIEDALLTKKHF